MLSGQHSRRLGKRDTKGIFSTHHESSTWKTANRTSSSSQNIVSTTTSEIMKKRKQKVKRTCGMFLLISAAALFLFEEDLGMLAEYQRRILFQEGGGEDALIQKEEPTHVQICRLLLEDSGPNNGGNNKIKDNEATNSIKNIHSNDSVEGNERFLSADEVETIVIQETKEICTSSSPFQSVVTIFASAVLTEKARALGFWNSHHGSSHISRLLHREEEDSEKHHHHHKRAKVPKRVEYKHDCHRFGSDTVQMNLPSPLLASPLAPLVQINGLNGVDGGDFGFGGFGNELEEVLTERNGLLRMCTMCVEEYESTLKTQSIKSDATVNNPMEEMEEDSVQTPAEEGLGGNNRLQTTADNLKSSKCILDQEEELIKVIPAMIQNVREATKLSNEIERNFVRDLQRIKEKSSSMLSEGDEDGKNEDQTSIRRLKSYSYMPFWAGIMRGMKRKTRKLLANPESDAPGHDGEDVAVIYIDGVGDLYASAAIDETGDHYFVRDYNNDDYSKIQVLPFYRYAQHIPRSLTNARIIITERCAKSIPGCNLYVNRLEDFLKRLLPRAKITVEDNMSTQDAFRAVLSADTVICPPGSMACILPTLARYEPSGRMVLGSGESVLVESPMYYPWLVKLPREMVAHVTFLPPETGRDLKVLHLNINQDGNSQISFTNEIYQFLYSPPTEVDTSTCLAVRGRLGWWKKDVDFASQLQYVTPLDHLFGFADSRYKKTWQDPYRRPTTFRWVEHESLSSCQVDVHNRESFCAIMRDLRVTRIFFVGDYVGMNQAYSLWKILGHEDTPKDITDTDPNWERDIVCAKVEGNEESGEGGRPEHIISLQFIRNDKMEENDRPVDLPKRVHNCDGVFCYKWTDKYLEYYNFNEDDVIEEQEKRTLLIASFGPHFYAEDHFATRMKEFLNVLSSKLQDRLNKDIIFFKNITPGHQYCNRKTSNYPFADYEEYKPTITWSYSWDLHDGFNDIADRMIREFNQHHFHHNRRLDAAAYYDGDKIDENSPMSGSIHFKSAPFGIINILDIYNMSVLRRDGHIGGTDCQRCRISNDCFHYSLPGPSDWWNHLLLSNLADMAKDEADTRHWQNNLFDEQFGDLSEESVFLAGPILPV